MHRSCPDESYCLCQIDDLFFQCLVWAGMSVLPECWMSSSSIYWTLTVCLIRTLAAANKLERKRWHCICPQGPRPLMGKWAERQTLMKTIKKEKRINYQRFKVPQLWLAAPWWDHLPTSAPPPLPPTPGTEPEQENRKESHILGARSPNFSYSGAITSSAISISL